MKTLSEVQLNGFRAACVPLTVRELARVKHDLQVALTEVLTTNEERSRTSQAHQQEQVATGNLRQQLLDAGEKVPSSLLQLSFNVNGMSLQLILRGGDNTTPGVCIVTNDDDKEKIPTV